MAEFVGVTSNPSINSAGVTTGNPDNRPSTAPTPPQISSRGKENANHEERLRLIREKHDEERQRKLEELKQQALAVQRCREQKEEERRRRLEEIRLRENDRRQQVEERKRQISEAEQEKRDALLKKNLEREARIIESKKRNDRGQQIFAFGSSTPRMLIEPSAGGSYWATRRSTSINHLPSIPPMGPLTSWRSSERVLNDCSVKKRAASAGGLSNRNDERGDGIVDRNEVRRRKTDLMPTITSPRDQTPSSRPGSASSSRRSPGRASSMTRLDGAGVAAPAFGGAGRGAAGRLSSARSMSHLAGGGGAGGRSAAALGGAAKDRSAHHRSMIALNPVPPPRLTRAERLRKRAREFANNGGGAGTKSGEMTPSRPPSSMSQSVTGPSSVQPRPKPQVASRKPRPVSIAGTGISLTDPFTKAVANNDKPPLPKVDANRKTPKVETKKFPSENIKQSTAKDKHKNAKPSKTSDNIESPEQPAAVAIPPSKDESSSSEVPVQKSDSDLTEGGENIMTTSMNLKKITTEEEAKAALAERRRLVREQAEREAELERQRLEAERLAEEERQRCEEEEQRRQEEEQLILLEEARKAEALRLQLAIEEQKRREEEEKKTREEELKMKLEKEEADRKAKEEAEKLRQEMEIRSKKEEEERIKRRERVLAIMMRTRKQDKENSDNASTKEETESTEQQAEENRETPSSDPMTTSQGPPLVSSDTEALLTAERNHSSVTTTTPPPTSDTQSNGLPLFKTSDGPRQNGHTNNGSGDKDEDEVIHLGDNNDHTTANGKVFDSEVKLNNVTNNLLDLSLEPIPSETLSTPKIIDIGMSKCIQDKAADFTAYQETNRSEQQIVVNDLLS